MIVVMPGYNKCVLVQHGNYFSFYCKLGTVSVKAGDKVKTGQVVGTVDTIGAEPPANGRGESSLPSPHRSVERQNAMPFRLRKELTRSPVDVLQVLYDDLVSHIK